MVAGKATNGVMQLEVGGLVVSNFFHSQTSPFGPASLQSSEVVCVMQ
jgi:hypothetical protein